MTVLVQMTVKPPDTARFVATAEKYAPQMAEMGAANGSPTSGSAGATRSRWTATPPTPSPVTAA